MIKFDIDENGDYVEFEPLTRMRGEARLFIGTCEDCGKKYRFTKNTKVELKKCSCANKEDELTMDGETRQLSKWAELYPEINVASARVRLSNRRTNKRDCTDAEVLFGYNKTNDPKIRLTRTGIDRWHEVLTNELNKRMHRMPLLEAIFESVALACRDESFSSVKKITEIYTAKGLEYRLYDLSLQELYEMQGGLAELKEYLRGEGLNDTQIASFFN